MTNTPLYAQHLAKYYGKKLVVNDVSLTIHQGQVVGLLGPNGAGKTTSFYMLVGLVPCDQGRVFLGGNDITHLPIHQRSRMGISYLPQESSIFRKLTVAENILGILELQPQLSKNERRDQLEKLLHEFNIGHLRNQDGQSLSGGERRRVEIARALATQPRFILLDEPFAGIDPLSIGDLKTLITHMQQLNIGVLITDHNVRETLGICQHAYIVNNGRVMIEGDQHVILNSHEVREVYLGHEFKL
jgi:lipopolysaccharide export system ATP-binding protein